MAAKFMAKVKPLAATAPMQTVARKENLRAARVAYRKIPYPAGALAAINESAIQAGSPRPGGHRQHMDNVCGHKVAGLIVPAAWLANAPGMGAMAARSSVTAKAAVDFS